MSTFEMPSLEVDSRVLPPPLLTSEPDSFAYRTFKVRIPRIVEEVIELNSFSSDVCTALADLRREIVSGTIRGLREMTPDKAYWDSVSRPYIGRTWLDVPWYWAEAFFYRRVLEATYYFQPGAWLNFDPYAAIKQTEWEPEAAPSSVNATLDELPPDLRGGFVRLLYASLWGNRTDLSYNVAAQVGQSRQLEDERPNLLVDDSARLWEYLRAEPRRRLALITDNAGTELLMDLALVDFVLSEGLAEQIVLHLKPQPFFVSDAMPVDVEAGLKALAPGGDAARALGERVRMHLEKGRLHLRTHWFYATSLFYFQLPEDLRAELAATDLVILKGDVNYRRLLGDAHWPSTIAFDRAIAYFPVPLVTLRTLKAELIVGLGAGQAERLREQDADWMVNGRRGVIQGNL